MKKIKFFLAKLIPYGINFGLIRLSLLRYPSFKNELKEFIRLSIRDGQRTNWPISAIQPRFKDRSTEGGTAKGDYFHQDLLVAKFIYRASPKNHCDVGSRIDGFIAHLAVFREVDVIDIRPIKSKVANINFRQFDLMSSYGKPDFQYESVSCLHALEHFGLGRYGDPLNPNGYIDGFSNIDKLLKSNGVLYLSVPISNYQRIEFHSQRIFHPRTITELYSKYDYKLESFHYVDDNGDLHENIQCELDIIPEIKILKGCGIFILRKL